MAQFDFLGTWEDSWQYLAALLEPGDIRFIDDREYDLPSPVFLTTFNETQQCCLKGSSKLFVWSDQFSVSQPFMRRISSGEDSRGYSVDSSRGGPLLELRLPRCYRYDAEGSPKQAFDGGPNLHLASGALMYYREYFNAATAEWTPTPQSVKAGYKELVRRIKTHLIRFLFHEPIWTGRDARREIEESNATIHGFGLD